MSDPGEHDDDGPLSRWSRRKALAQRTAAAALPEAAAEPPAAEAVAAVEPDEPDERTEAEILEDLGLPAPESLQRGDDFSGFLRASVPEGLRRRALRRLWLSNPVLANLDGLVDYGEDYTDAALAVADGMLKTAYKVGRGFVTDAELAGEREPPAALDAGPEDAEIGEAALEQHAADDTAEDDRSAEAALDAEAGPLVTDRAASTAAEMESVGHEAEARAGSEPPERMARRMSFRFETK